jgi:uncharacterized membrane protein
MSAPTGLPTHDRSLALDWLRGLAMVLMTLDHVDAATNPNHAQGDSALFAAAAPLSPPDFLTRWATHLCAPTFLLLAGAGIALSGARAAARGESTAAFDRHLVRRGLVLIALELTLVSMYWRAAERFPSATPGLPVFVQVLFALGGGFIALAWLRHLSARAQLALAAAVLVGAEFARLATLDGGLRGPFAVQLLATGGLWSWTPGDDPWAFDAMVLYPLLPWLPVLLLGHALGQSFAARGLRPRHLALLGLASLAGFALLRGFDGFGNMGLHRRTPELLEWLHCSKYPPSASFLAMELGLVALLLAALAAAERGLARLPRLDPVLVLGQVPLFFYLLHLPMIGALMALGLLPPHGGGSAGGSWLRALLVVACCWPLCALYRRYKQRQRGGWTRYL